MLLLPLLAAAAGAQIAYPSYPSSQDFTVAARWLEREAAIARRDLVAVHNGLAWAIRPQDGPPAPGQPTALRVETLGPAAWRALGGRSAVVFLDADCEARRAVVRRADVYAASNLFGTPQAAVAPAALGLDPLTLDAVVVGLCGRSPASAAKVALAPPPPLPAPPRAQPAPVRSDAVKAAPPVPPKPAPQPAPQPAPRAVAAAAQLPKAAAAPIPPPPEPGPGAAVQVGTFSSAGAAMVALRELSAAQPKLMAGKLQRLEPISAQGGQLYRALLTGFAREAEARTFCEALTRAGTPCVVRPAP